MDGDPKRAWTSESFLADHRKLTGAARINIRAEDYGAEVTVNGTRYKIMSLKPRSRKYSVIAMALSSSKLPHGKIGKSEWWLPATGPGKQTGCRTITMVVPTQRRFWMR